VAYGYEPGLADCIKALRLLSEVADIVVVDNLGDVRVTALCDGAVVTYVDPGANIGYGRAVNLGALSIHRPQWTHLLVINPDVVLQSVRALLDALPRGACATACLARLDGSLDANVRPATTMRSEVMRAFRGTRACGAVAPALDDGVETVAQAAGSLLLLERAVWEALAGFDERFELYYEDVDLCRRLDGVGRVVRARSLAGQHSGGTAYRRNRIEAYVAMRVSRLRYLRKWYGTPGALCSIVTTVIEVVTRGAGACEEGWRARLRALKLVLREAAVPGCVWVLSRAGEGAVAGVCGDGRGHDHSSG
jgi:GT2 family glycosyltransferase